jgi:hypothetical protein
MEICLKVNGKMMSAKVWLRIEVVVVSLKVNMLMTKEMENVYLFFTGIISGGVNAFSGETALPAGDARLHDPSRWREEKLIRSRDKSSHLAFNEANFGGNKNHTLAPPEK